MSHTHTQRPENTGELIKFSHANNNKFSGGWCRRCSINLKVWEIPGIEVFSGCPASIVIRQLKQWEVGCRYKKEKSNADESDRAQFSLGPMFQLKQKLCNTSRVI